MLENPDGFPPTPTDWTELGVYRSHAALLHALPTTTDVRLAHVPTHSVHAPVFRKARRREWLRSVLREMGDYFVGAFQSVPA